MYIRFFAVTSIQLKFIKSFEKLQISIKPPDGKRRVKKKLFNCLEGIFYDDVTKKDYWRVRDDWYEVSSKYCIEVSKEYFRVIRASLLNESDCYLSIKWPLKPDREIPQKKDVQPKIYRLNVNSYKQSRYVKEGDYCNLYETVPHVVVTDSRVIFYGIEICDFFQHITNLNGKSTIYLYHVKKAFGADGYRSVTCQILQSANLLYNAFNCEGGSTDSSTYKLFEFLQEKYQYKNYKEFLTLLKNTTFVLSLLFASGSRELDKDMILTKYNFSDFEDQIDIAFRENLKNKLDSFMLNNEFIHSDGEFTNKWFEACSVVNDRGFHIQNENGFFVDPFPGKKFSNLTPQALRKILKAKYFKTVNELSTKPLIVQTQNALKAMGFGFKICQIEGEKDTLL